MGGPRGLVSGPFLPVDTNRMPISMLGAVVGALVAPIMLSGELIKTGQWRHVPITMQYSGETTRGLESLSPPQQKAFVAAMSSDDVSIPMLVTADAAAWARVREANPELQNLTDDELSAALSSYINTPPSLSDVLLKTPVGPVVLINIVFAVTGMSWCDIPFVPTDTTGARSIARGSVPSVGRTRRCPPQLSSVCCSIRAWQLVSNLQRDPPLDDTL